MHDFCVLDIDVMSVHMMCTLCLNDVMSIHMSCVNQFLSHDSKLQHLMA